MHAWIRRALCAVGLTGGIVLLGLGLAEAASADGDGPVTTGQNGILSGNQTGVAVSAPINLSGNQITVIGQHNTTTSTGSASSPADSSGSGSPTTSGQSGIGSGNQTAVHAQAPINVSGNQVTVIGQHNTVGGAGGSATAHPAAGSGSPTTSGQGGIGSGNQTAVDVQAPINVSGNQVTVIGQDNAVHSVAGTSTGTATGTGGAAPTTTGQNGLIAGNQTAIGIALPINLSGNQVTVIGQDNTDSSLGGAATNTGGGSGAATGGATTSGEDGILSGNQTGIAVAAPIAATGNQVTVIGQHNTNTSTGGASTGGGQGATTETTSGAGGIGSGNQTDVSVQVPIDTSGNQVTVIGQDNTNTSTSTATTGGGGGTTPGGYTTSPPGGGVVSPPSTGGATPHGAAPPGTTTLPSTGMGADLPALALLGLVLALLGAGLLRRKGAAPCRC